MIRAVSLDAGGTLVTPFPSVGHVYAQVATEAGVANCRPDDLTRRFTMAWRNRGDFPYTREAWRDVVSRTFDRLCDAEVAHSFFPALYERFSHPASWHLYDDVLPTLEQLRDRGVPVCITSNWDERLVPLMEGLGLQPFLRGVIASGPLGVHKPSPGIFRRACAVLGLPPEEVLHVGDSLEEDHDGAVSAGLQARWLRRAERFQGDGLRVVTSLGELPGLIDSPGA